MNAKDEIRGICHEWLDEAIETNSIADGLAEAIHAHEQEAVRRVVRRTVVFTIVRYEEKYKLKKLSCEEADSLMDEAIRKVAETTGGEDD